MTLTARRYLCLLLSACALLLSCATTTHAKQSGDEDDPKPTIAATFGVASYFRAGSWCPVRVHITGGSIPTDGDVVLAVGRGPHTDMVTRARFAATPAKTTFVDLCVPIVETSRWGNNERWATIELRDNRGRLLRIARYTEHGSGTTIQFFAQILAPEDCFITGAGRTSLREATNKWGMNEQDREDLGQIFFQQSLPETLPTRATGYDPLSVLVLTQDAMDELDSAQRSAIANWIVAGGRAILIANAPDINLAWLPGGAPVRASIDSGRPRLTLTPNAESRGWTVRSIPPPTESQDDSDPDARTIANASPDRGVDAIASGIVGGGWVTVLADAPEDIYPWGDRAALWREVLDTTIDLDTLKTEEDYYYYGYRSDQQGSVNATLNAIADRMELKSRFPVALFAITLTLLALLVGPVDRLVLKRLRLSGMAWLSALVWVGVVSIIAYFGPRILRTSSSIQHRLVVTDINTLDHTASQTGIVAFFAGKSGPRGLDGAPPDSWWRSASTVKNYWDNKPTGALTLRNEQTVGSRPSRVYMGVWTFNAIMDDAITNARYTGRLIADASSRRYIELQGVPTNATDIRVTWGVRSFTAEHDRGDRWTLSAIMPSDARETRSMRRRPRAWHDEYNAELEAFDTSAYALPGPARRTHSFTNACRSNDLAMVYLTLPDQESEVQITTSGAPEAARSIKSEFVRMLVPVVREDAS